MIVVMTCMDEQGKKIGKLISEKMEIPYMDSEMISDVDSDADSDADSDVDIDMDSVMSRNLNRDEAGNTMAAVIREIRKKPYSSRILLTDRICQPENEKDIIYLCLYQETSKEEIQKNWSDLVEYDICMKTDRMGVRACGEAICQYIAIHMMKAK